MAIIAHDTDFNEVSYEQRDELMSLLYTSGYEGRELLWRKLQIHLACSQEDYENLKQDFLINQIGFDSAVNPGQREINRHLRRIVKHPNK